MLTSTPGLKHTHTCRLNPFTFRAANTQYEIQVRIIRLLSLLLIIISVQQPNSHASQDLLTSLTHQGPLHWQHVGRITRTQRILKISSPPVVPEPGKRESFHSWKKPQTPRDRLASAHVGCWQAKVAGWSQQLAVWYFLVCVSFVELLYSWLLYGLLASFCITPRAVLLLLFSSWKHKVRWETCQEREKLDITGWETSECLLDCSVNVFCGFDSSWFLMLRISTITSAWLSEFNRFCTDPLNKSCESSFTHYWILFLFSVGS